jgi:hypothetical protein
MWLASYYGRFAEASGSAPAPEHLGDVLFQVSPAAPRPSGFGANGEPIHQNALLPGSCLFVFALTKYDDASA